MDELHDCLSHILMFYIRLKVNSYNKEERLPTKWYCHNLIILYQRFSSFHIALSSILFDTYQTKSLLEFIIKSQLKYNHSLLPFVPTTLKRHAIESDNPNILDRWYLNDITMVRTYNNCKDKIAQHIEDKYLHYHKPRTSIQVMIGLSTKHPNDINLTSASGYQYSNVHYEILNGWIQRKEYKFQDIIEFILMNQ